MSSDRPLFDDEELPAWMQKGGIEPEASGDSSSTPDSDDLSWLDEAAPDADKPAQAATSDNDLPWLADAAPASSTPNATPTSDMPAWAQDPEGSGLSPFDLDKIEAAPSRPGVTSTVPQLEV